MAGAVASNLGVAVGASAGNADEDFQADMEAFLARLDPTLDPSVMEIETVKFGIDRSGLSFTAVMSIYQKIEQEQNEGNKKATQ